MLLWGSASGLVSLSKLCFYVKASNGRLLLGQVIWKSNVCLVWCTPSVLHANLGQAREELVCCQQLIWPQHVDILLCVLLLLQVASLRLKIAYVCAWCAHMPMQVRSRFTGRIEGIFLQHLSRSVDIGWVTSLFIRFAHYIITGIFLAVHVLVLQVFHESCALQDLLKILTIRTCLFLIRVLFNYCRFADDLVGTFDILQLLHNVLVK